MEHSECHKTVQRGRHRQEKAGGGRLEQAQPCIALIIVPWLYCLQDSEALARVIFGCKQQKPTLANFNRRKKL